MTCKKVNQRHGFIKENIPKYTYRLYFTRYEQNVNDFGLANIKLV